MKRLSGALLFLCMFILLVSAASFVAAYGVTFYSPEWNPQDGKVYDVVEAGQPYDLVVKAPGIAITRIIFYVESDFTNAGITVYNLRSLPEDIPETSEFTYEVNEIKYVGFVPKHTTDFVYYFKVNKTWLEENSLPRSTVALHYLDEDSESWVALDTVVEEDDMSYVYYRAEHVGVHYLHIGVSDGSAASEETDDVAVVIGGEESDVAVVDDSGVQLSEEVAVEQLGPDASDTVEMAEVSPVDLDAPKTPVPMPINEPVPPTRSEMDDDSSLKLVYALTIIVLFFIALILIMVRRRRPDVDKALRKYVRDSLKQGHSKAEIRERLLEVGWHRDRVERVLSKYRAPVKETAKPVRTSHANHAKAHLDVDAKVHAATGHGTTGISAVHDDISSFSDMPNEEVSEDAGDVPHEVWTMDPIERIKHLHDVQPPGAGSSKKTVVKKNSVKKTPVRKKSAKTAVVKKKSVVKKKAVKKSVKNKVVKKKSAKKSPVKKPVKKKVAKKTTAKKTAVKKKAVKKKVAKKKIAKKKTVKKKVVNKTATKPKSAKKNAVKKKAVKKKAAKKKVAKKKTVKKKSVKKKK